MKKSYPIVGMHCASCAKLIERKLGKIPGVISSSVNYGNETAYVDGGKFNEIKKAIEGLGYKIGDNEDSEASSELKKKELKNLKIKVIISIVSAIFVMFLPKYFSIM